MKTSISLIIVTISFSMLLSTSDAYSQSSIELQQVLNQVKEKSFNIKTAINNKQIIVEDNKFFKSLLKPSLTFYGDLPNYNKTSSSVIQPDGSIAFQSIRQSNSSVSLYASQVISKTGGTIYANSALQRFDDFSSDYRTYNGIPIRLGISQPIFGYNPWKYDKVIQPLLIEEANKSYNVNVESALNSATNLYFDILIATQSLEIASTNEDVNRKLLVITDERLKLGKVSRDEKLQLEIELNNARLDVSQAFNDLEKAKAALFTFIGTESQLIDDYKEPSQFPTIMIDRAELMEAYRRNRPEVITYQKRLKESDQEIARTKANYGFQANINASVGFARGSENPSAIYSDPYDEQQINLSIQVPILDWGRKKAAVTKTEILKQDITDAYDQQILELENSIHQASLTFERLQRDISLLKEIMQKADERFAISNERYILGNIDITNLTLAQREKDQAKKNYINSLKSYWTTYYQLRLLTGYDIVTKQNIIY